MELLGHFTALAEVGFVDAAQHVAGGGVGIVVGSAPGLQRLAALTQAVLDFIGALLGEGHFHGWFLGLAFDVNRFVCLLLNAIMIKIFIFCKVFA